MIPDPHALASAPWLAAIAWAYLVTNVGRIVTYVPQIVAVWRCTDGARAISLFTWGSWMVANATALAYGALVLKDLFFLAITGINMFGCSAVTLIAAWRRIAFRRAQRGAAQALPPATQRGCLVRANEQELTCTSIALPPR
ncbi:hypothetical protein [Pseudorhodoferax sp.]|uniref:hypothetical protein n=1 Tax=Pseudorhodoferax sp. TaxID=1993553 RepID=UPI0039E45363